MSDITRVGVIGAGLMGSGIAEVCARAGLNVLVREIDDAALADRDLVVEAATENPAVKYALFAELGEAVKRPNAILATNTSSIPIVEVARATTRPQQVIGLHFFNPAPVQKLVELIPSVLTADDTASRARAFVTGVLGKTAIGAPDRSGFVVNALLVPYLLSAAPPLRMTAAGLLGRKSGRGFYDYQEQQ